ncbi:unnamed protein product [Fusarium graminearum]|nr:unnamed protein product [Fusarium graminearum]
MKSQFAALALLGSVFASPSDILDVEVANLNHATYCITYESTYLVPVSFGTNYSESGSSTIEGSESLSPGSASLPLLTTADEVATTVSATDTEQPSSPTDTTAEPPTLVPTGQRVIFLVTPSGELTKRDVGGFVGQGNPDVCTFATVFTLGQGRLFEGDFPISYSGEGFQELHSSSSLGASAITTTFSSEGGVLAFSNPSLPGGKASFCQTLSDGQVYITYNSRPSGCVLVTLTVYGVERCIDDKIDGPDTTTNGFTQSDGGDVTISPSTEPNASTGPETEVPVISESNGLYNTDDPTIGRTSDGGGIAFPTLSVVSTRSWSNQTSRPSSTLKDPDVPSNTDIVLSATSFEDKTPVSTEDRNPISSSEDVSTSEGFSDPVTSTTFATVDIPSSTTLAESTITASSGDAESTMSEGSELDSSTTLITPLESTTMEATSTSAETTTTTQEPALVARSITRNGRFAGSDPNSPGSIEGWTTAGEAMLDNERCYKDDGSIDNGCVILSVSGGTDNRHKRDKFSSSIEQYVTGLEMFTTYTIQFYYLITGTSRTGSCEIFGTAGIDVFYTEDIIFSESSVPWQRGIGTVTADLDRAPITISLSCTGGGSAVVRVDSVFASNEVTPDNIYEYELDYGSEGN